MNEWIKIFSFDNVFEAEIRKQLLTSAGIESVVVNARDSLFLVGQVDLYVHQNDEKKAVIILEQMQGITKINSFILKKPVELFQLFLKDKGIDTILKERSDNNYILENFELYVENEKVEQVLPYLTGKKIDSWSKVAVTDHVRQARYRVELLEAYKIPSFIIKKRNSDYHLEEISIYVKNEKSEEAKSILAELKDWTEIREYKKFEVAELKEDVLGRHGIRALIVPKEDAFAFYVLSGKVDEAKDILKANKEWIEVRRYNDFVSAENDLLLLQGNGIDASILTLRDTVFIIGGYALYVEKVKLNEALNLLTEATGGSISEE